MTLLSYVSLPIVDNDEVQGYIRLSIDHPYARKTSITIDEALTEEFINKIKK